jgi:CRISPR-associated protein (TIGR02710 family)
MNTSNALRVARQESWSILAQTPEPDRQRCYHETYLPAALAVMRAEGRETDVLVLTAGTQPYSMAMSLCFRRARHRVVFIHTEESLEHAREAARLAGVDRDLVRERHVDKADSAAVYRHIRDIHEELGSDHEIVVDFTSGSKAMTGGASAVAGLLTLSQVYVESTAKVKVPSGVMFGLEEAHVVDHPLVVFGDATRAEAERAWADGRFERAAAAFRQLRLAGVAGYHWEAREALAVAYGAWDTLEFHLAIKPLERAAEGLRAAVTRNFREDAGLIAQAQVVAAQARAARALNDAMQSKAKPWAEPQQAQALIRYLLGRSSRSAPDTGALLAYRALELCVQRRLGAHGIAAKAPAWPDPPGAAALLERYNALVKPAHRLQALPDPISLVQGWSVLGALGDKVVTGLSQTVLDHSQKRNASIYAHGFSRLSESTAADFLGSVVEVAQRVVEEDGLPFDWPDPQYLPVRLTG